MKELDFTKVLATADRLDVVASMVQGLRQFAKSVMVISCQHQDIRYAMAATAVTEVSLDPPTMLICVNRAANIHGPLLAGADFAINMLHSQQEHIARNCSGLLRGEDRFTEGNWQSRQSGPPVLADALAYYVCRQEQRIDHGTHSIFIGHVVDAHTAEGLGPLIYVDGRYLTPSEPE
jgi:flavin reductase (DIM6/NTAB) family NADH-FMN oxidoreductase RutF